MKRTWTIIGLGDVPRSFKWYQSLFGQPATLPAHDYFGQILDSDGPVKTRATRRPLALALTGHKEYRDMKPKNTIGLWFDKDALEAARFYAATFPDSKVTPVHNAPGDYPSDKEADVLTVEFTVLGIPCLGLDGGPAFKHSEAFSFQIATENQEEERARPTT